MITIKSPQILFWLICIQIFIIFLLISVYNGIGADRLDFFDIKNSRKIILNWIGFCKYLNQDCFAFCFFSNIVSLPNYNPVYRREVKSGLYSPNMYYLGNWIFKVVFLSFYPTFLISILFPFLDLVDNSNYNL